MLERIALWLKVLALTICVCQYGCTVYNRPKDGFARSEHKFEFIFRTAPEDCLLSEIASFEKGEGMICPYHGSPDTLLAEYATNILQQSSRMDWRDTSGYSSLKGHFMLESTVYDSRVKFDNYYWSRERLLALASIDNPFPCECGYKFWVDHLKASAASNICDRGEGKR